MTPTLRPFAPADGPALLDLHRAAIHAIPDTLYTDEERASWMAGRAASDYALAAEGGEYLTVAELDGAVAGFSGRQMHEGAAGEIVGLYVDPAVQGRGVARALLAAAELALFEDGALRIAVTASLAARGFYAAHGYTEIAPAQHETRGGLDLPVVRMEKTRSALRPDGTPWRNFYGRRKGKKLRPAQQRDMDQLHATIAPKGVTRAENPERTPLDLPALFGRDAPVWLEIGFGGGEHLFHQARTYPEVGLIGCEPFINGVAQLLSKMREDRLENVRIHPGDARDLLEVLPEASLDRAFLLYPDPWPKTRHHRRRFANPENFAMLARALKPGAHLRVATDIEDYVRHTLEVVHAMPEFEWTAEGPADWSEPWGDWIRTRYEAKAIREGRTPHYLTFLRI